MSETEEQIRPAFDLRGGKNLKATVSEKRRVIKKLPANPVLASRFRQRKFCISILFLRNPKNRLTHCPVEFYNSLNRLHFGDVEKQCMAREQEAAVCGASVPTSLSLDRKAVVFVFR